MIAVTCRNGEHFSVDPDHIERIERHGDTVVHLVDGTHYVVETEFEEVLRSIAAHRAGALVARSRLTNGYAAMPAAARLARRHGSGRAPEPELGAVPN
ncbi:flagellar protein FlbD [Blastococcus sp. DSM 46786]|uniref:flagellar FlbD family protein n=1 Tax=Blastococcus sp. DSM 46786 TaxID=1798227 RepID=UPI0008CB2226|nr:flagellar FlbD family protein [Blastococcus sp. DSM 46786]SEK83266.1 flagellar protein FlbD [Blastococcus sp. DSM 46786]